MHLDFVKMHGLGNDFVMIDNMSGVLTLSPEQVIRICDRHFGVGADGVILVEAGVDGSDGFMNYINSDGTFAQMCGNGVRCCAKFLVDQGYVAEDETCLDISTRSGVKHIEFSRDAQGRLDMAAVNMGKPMLAADAIPVSLDDNGRTSNGELFVKEAMIPSPWDGLAFTCVSMGNPHAVCFIDDIDSLSDDLFNVDGVKSLEGLDLDLIGSHFESHEVFPEKTNVEFAVMSDDGIEMRVFERGCGETLACGTGACATSVAAFLTGRAPRANDVHLLGGTLRIEWDGNGDVIMTGSAKTSFCGSMDLDL